MQALAARLEKFGDDRVWRGRLWARGAGSYRLLCYGQGEVDVKLAGKTVLSGQAEQPQWLTSQPLNLDFDYHPLEISFNNKGRTAQLALFQPLRRLLQTIIDRRFYRRKYDAAKVMAAFGTTLRTEVDVGTLREQLLAIVQETMQPTHVSLWIRPAQQDGKHKTA